MRKFFRTAFALSILVGPAMADTRDDALAAVRRCTAIPEAIARLSCYDGAARGVGAVFQGQAQTVPPPAYSGGAMNQANPSFQAAMSPPPPRKSGFLPSIFGDGSPDRAPQTSVQQFGIESVSLRGEMAYPRPIPGDTIDSISARLAAYHFEEPNRLVVTLDNGQDWIQIMGGDPVTGLTRPARVYSAQIRRGYRGTYLMVLSSIPKPIHVRRLH